MKDFRPFLVANFRGQLLFLISNKFKGLLILNKFCSTDVYKYVLNYIWEKHLRSSPFMSSSGPFNKLSTVAYYRVHHSDIPSSV